jgi:HupE / UreJ protein
MRALLLLTMAAPLFAHVISLSTGEATMNGARLDYELRMPLHEAAHMQQPERELFDNIHFSVEARPARLIEHSCREQEETLICHGAYMFPEPVDIFDVECTFAYITVDASYTKVQIRLQEFTALERIRTALWSGLRAGAMGIAQILFLIALAIAARGKGFATLVLSFFAGEASGCLLAPHLPWAMSPRFIEAASALTVAYIAAEALFLPAAGKRWIIAALCGIIHGLSFSLIVAGGGFQTAPLLAGVFLAQCVVALALAGIARAGSAFGAARIPIQPARALASVLAIIGLGWFILRLR